MDYCYQCEELAVLLQEKYQVLSCGSDKYDHHHNVLFLYWKSNMVIHFISTLDRLGLPTVLEMIESVQIHVNCEKNVNYGEDMVDYHMKAGGGILINSLSRSSTRESTMRF